MTIPELKVFFSTHTIPDTLELSPAEHISNLPKFLESHFFIAESLVTVPAFGSFHYRLNKVKDIILEQEKL